MRFYFESGNDVWWRYEWYNNNWRYIQWPGQYRSNTWQIMPWFEEVVK